MRLCTIAAVLIAASVVGARQEVDPEDPQVACSLRLRAIVQACIEHGQKHGGFPPDLAAAAPLLGEGGEAAVTRELIQSHFVSPADPDLRVPPDAGPEWINTHSSYVYLGRAGVAWKDVPEWGTTVVAHLRLDRPHPAEVTPDNPTGEGFMLAYADNHVEFVINRDQAERAITESKQTWEALATGGPFPDRIQSLWNLTRIAQGVRAYAESHAGELPPTLGDVLPFVPPDAKRAATPRQRAALFLSARAQKNTFVPEDPTPEWVNRNTSYIYLGSGAEPGALHLARVADPGRTLLVHAKPADVIDIPGGGDFAGRRLALVTVSGEASTQPEEYAMWIIGESRKVFDAAMGRGPLPDFPHAMHDLRLLWQATKAYSDAHEGKLPAELGDVFDFIPVEGLPAPTAVERARVFLSPKLERSTEVPDEPDAAWIRTHTSYIYLGGAGLTLREAMNAAGSVLIHAPLGEPYAIVEYYGRASVIAMALDHGQIFDCSPELAEGEIAKSKAGLDGARRNQPPP